MEKEFPNYFKTYRKRHGLAQKQMAQLLGKDRFYIVKLENGERKPSFQTLMAYSILFGVDVPKLMPEFCRYTCKLLKERINNQPHFFRDERTLAIIKKRLNCDELDINSNYNNHDK